ncbi:alpha-oxoamine synthase/8-amino-7-oxononanoate synthase [Gluconobacter thailandicus F149-1 = NBRC 100600]|uniref:8-amino-7-oxononanoate synthase n=1 Tax=Gluconobacter thailandicus NBRC 3257 TaxID=1381097 RepID=A0ABQ0IUX5_GLUTH|nr:8-amino-7-oxononanoate synthase [Gluconobacter thailandicus]KXV52189.1 8-amino-7-oxononanoate synthase [Gluconobacter thailandicus]GAC86418.1 8-amino-7-oxononanoate synthase [Gluconobacter thailandicus NBRC 3255]GAD25980.1 8-amino-7-oxononanoate synthase [Gluconobacter thailandicus NBRC 3257]GAN93583.1 alpha-oxoamine synthase/8-amino-7-oxononanoate synthase [Gluconobacter thailandicus F149-1 = NBRC 100600]GBR60042.1 8-amino-7-oxononanoate synthase [Gluconobacter thailandicus F149-1 = NBRC 1
MTLFDAHFAAALQKRDAVGTRRVLRPVTRETGAILRDGQRLIDVSSNDYLGLADHPLLRERAADWALRYGTGARASRLVSGTLDLHQAVEEKLARFKHCDAALLFASGWQANASVVPALCALSVAQTGHPMIVFSDRLNHASLHHGCAAAGVRQVRFRHNDLAHLETLLKREAATPGLRMIVTESVFSMDGDRADIPALRSLADRYDAFLYVDEAHATGVLGPQGEGLSGGLADLTMGTCSKALGGMGAYIAGSRLLCDYLINHASGFIYSTALPPAVLGAIDTALDVIPGMDTERKTLLGQAGTLRTILNNAGFDTAESTTQIVPVLIGEAQRALDVATALEGEGFLTVAIRPPTVPAGTARLRIALHVGLQDADVERLAAAIIRLVGKEQ